jgi:hypothetical protein
MPKLISLKIDVTKINKERLYKGAKGTYLDATVYLLDEPDEYGNFGMITEGVTKEERENGVKGAILGNAKVLKDFGKDEQKKPVNEPARRQGATPSQSININDEDLLF